MKAIALISGGLDSNLAAKLIQEQGIDIIPVKFKIPFLHGNKDEAGDNLSVKLKIIDIGNDFLKMLKNPEHGYGANMNPCIDCKILMLRRAKELMPEFGAAFIITGEVLGQRPMSQNTKTLYTIVKKAALEDLVVRPLSAKLLPQTLPEKEGWINRRNLLDFNGRSRKPQIELAKVFGFKDYAQPAGGCLLTDPAFSRRLKDLIIHQDLNINNVELLKIGRHFRLTSKTKLVVGRNEGENERLVEFAQD
jgi:tRNA-specific 2-thiouridylase